MSDLTITAQRARELVREQHKAEIASITKQMKAWRIAGILGLSELIFGLLAFLAHDPEPGWRGKRDAPPMQRVQVITTGFMDKEGQWRSFDNGEPITTHLWKP